MVEWQTLKSKSSGEYQREENQRSHRKRCLDEHQRGGYQCWEKQGRRSWGPRKKKREERRKKRPDLQSSWCLMYLKRTRRGERARLSTSQRLVGPSPSLLRHLLRRMLDQGHSESRSGHSEMNPGGALTAKGHAAQHSRDESWPELSCFQQQYQDHPGHNTQLAGPASPK